MGALYFDQTLGIDENRRAQPVKSMLNPTYPNPFNPSAVISYQLSAASQVNLSVYNSAGRQVAELVHGWREAGIHEVTFDGSGLASGIYIYRLTANDQVASGKMLLLR